MFRHGRSSVLIFATSLLIFAPFASAQFQNPITAAKDAYNKAKAQAKQQQQQQQQPQQQSSQPAANASPATANSQQGSDAPWVPPSDAVSAPTPGVAPAAVNLDPAKLPDILGVHLGMTLSEALAAAHKSYPDDMFQEMTAVTWPSTTKTEYGYNILNRTLHLSKDMVLSFTAPPETQRVWMVARQTFKIHTNRNTLLAALRQKYGKETLAFQESDPRPVTNDAAMHILIWLYDEQGNRVPMPPSTVFPGTGTIADCPIGGLEEPTMPTEDTFERGYPAWCQAHFVALKVIIGSMDIVEDTTTTLVDVPLAIRNSHSAAAFLRDYASKKHQEDLQRSKENKPTL